MSYKHLRDTVPEFEIYYDLDKNTKMKWSKTTNRGIGIVREFEITLDLKIEMWDIGGMYPVYEHDGGHKPRESVWPGYEKAREYIRNKVRAQDKRNIDYGAEKPHEAIVEWLKDPEIDMSLRMRHMPGFYLVGDHKGEVYTISETIEVTSVNRVWTEIKNKQISIYWQDPYSTFLVSRVSQPEHWVEEVARVKATMERIPS